VRCVACMYICVRINVCKYMPVCVCVRCVCMSVNVRVFMPTCTYAGSLQPLWCFCSTTYTTPVHSCIMMYTFVSSSITCVRQVQRH
jgi:hypothetical protein